MTEETSFHGGEIIDAASQLMSTHFQKWIHFSKVIQLSEPERRNLILRLVIDNPTTEIPHSLILKQTAIDQKIYDNEAKGERESEHEQLNRFAHDWAGIEFLTQVGTTHAPYFYAGSAEHKFILIEDLGLAHPSLVGPLTKTSSDINREEAEKSLTSYMRRLGRMHADTAGKSQQFNATLNKIYSRATHSRWILKSEPIKILNQFKLLVGTESQELNQEIHSIFEFANSANEFNTLLHGDICPDNVYYQDHEIRLIDFEFCDFGNALIDGVYLRMCMPSCWCSKSVPDDILKKMEFAYREELKKGILAAADDAIYNEQLAYACGYWLMLTIYQLDDMDLIDHEWICPSGPIDSDSLWEPEKNAFRPRILSRLDAFIKCANETGHFPALSEASKLLLTHLKKIWTETNYIDLFPVFK